VLIANVVTADDTESRVTRTRAKAMLATRVLNIFPKIHSVQKMPVSQIAQPTARRKLELRYSNERYRYAVTPVTFTRWRSVPLRASKGRRLIGM
jgi:hypothetical protein